MNFLNKSKLKKRGWTDAKIRDWLPEPEKETINPYYRTGPKIKMWSEKIINEIESSEKFKEWIIKSKEKRSKASIKMIEINSKKKKELLYFVDSIEIKFPKFSNEELFKNAIEHYNYLWESRENYEKFATIDSEPNFLNRIAINYLRHEYNNYEHELSELFGVIGKEEGYLLLKTKINKMILEQFPYLKN